MTVNDMDKNRTDLSEETMEQRRKRISVQNRMLGLLLGAIVVLLFAVSIVRTGAGS
ncbi:hypothetical protein [Kiloniella sp. b19]|uniref:hypothetical protein n=1 Tax=Kiloniella sp. GXU_MW_B19 TaxID=3141326 RepID=UPI0031D8789B